MSENFAKWKTALLSGEVASGGDDSLDNLMLICPNCHGEIHGKIDGEAFVESLNRLARLASASQTNC